MIKHWHYYRLPNGTRLLASWESPPDRWRFDDGADDNDRPLYVEDVQRRGNLLRLTPHGDGSGWSAVSPSDLTLDDLVPTGEVWT